MAAAALLSLVASPASHAANYYWDQDANATGDNAVTGAGLGGTGTWDSSSLFWWDGVSGTDAPWVNSANNFAYFTGTAGTVSLGEPITVGGLFFGSSGYVLTGSTLTLGGAAPSVQLGYGLFATIASTVAGNSGLTKTGGGMIYLSNAGNTYTGVTTISGGSVVISNAGALGLDTSDIVVTGSATRGFGGGSLVLAGGYGSGVTITRNLSLSGYGPLADRGGALVSLRDNTLSGAVNGGVGSVNTRLISVAGALQIAGALNAPGTVGTNFVVLGGINVANAGNFVLSGPLTGSGSLEKTGGGTLFLNPSSSSGFSGVLRLSASATVGQSSVRITTPGVLGTRTAGTTSSVLDFNGGILEVLMDAPSVQAGGAAALVYHRANTNTIFVDHAAGSSVQNGVLTLGAFAFEENATFNFAGRNGYGVTVGATPVQGGTNNSTINNSSSGLVTFNGTFWSNSDNTGARTLTLGGAGNFLINGVITASAASFDHSITKSGAGTLTIASINSTLDGNFNMSGGPVVAVDFTSLGASSNANSIKIGSTTTAGTLTFGDFAAATQVGLATTRALDLAGTTGGATINASQTVAFPVSLSTVTASGVGIKILTLGGTSTQENIITGAIPDSSSGATSLVKTDAGTWVLTGANTFTGTSTITGGTLRLRATAAASDILKTGAFTFNANATTGAAGGAFEFVGVSGSATTEALGALTLTAGAGTITLTSGGAAAASNLTFTSLAAPAKTVGLNFDLTGAAGGTVTLTGQVAPTATTLTGNGHLYYNGADFAIANASGVLAAPVYGTTTGFVNAASALTAANHNLLTGSFSQGALTVSSLKLTTQTLTLSGLLTINLGGTGNDGAILQTGGTGTINGTGVTTGGAAAVVIRVNGSSDVLNLGAPLTSTTTGGLTKNGAGKLVISGTNAQTGTTTINEGTVQFSGTGRLSATSAALVLRQGATLDLNGVSQTVAAFDGAGTVANTSASAVTFSIASGTVFSGKIDQTTGVIGLTKTGTTSAVFTGLNTYTGVTTLNMTSTGVLGVSVLANIGQASGLGKGDATNDATNAASLVFTGTSTSGLRYDGLTSVTTDRLFTIAGLGANSGVFISNASANNSSLVFSKTNALTFAGGLTGSQEIRLGGASTADNLINLQLVDNGFLKTTVFKQDAGTWVLGNAANSYTGTTTVGQGVLIATDGGSLPTASGLILGSTTNSGVLQTTGSFTRSVAVIGSAGSGTVTWNGTTGGGGFANNSSNGDKLVVSLGGLLTPTALTWGAGGFVGTGGTQTLFLGSALSLGEVEFRNAIDLNGGARTIQADDNTNTGADFVTLTGVLSGAGGSLSKAGSGILQLLGANTYTGTTTISAGSLLVTSLGNSANPGQATSIGISTNANTNPLLLGGGGTTAASLDYIGPGEVSDRLIRLNTSTGSVQIHADGSGPLVLTNVLNDGTAGAKTLSLRGSSASANMISSILADNGGALAVTVDGAATWILTGANTYSGTTTISASALGIGSAGALGTGTVLLNNGVMFAYGADRTITNSSFQQSDNTTMAFVGDYSLAFTGALALLSGSNNSATTNNIASGKTLTFASANANAITANRTWTFNGSGDTIINGAITTSTAFGLNLTYSGTGSLTLNGAATALISGTTLTVSSGRLKWGANDVIPDGATGGNVTVSPAAGASATLDLNGKSDTINGLTANGLGTTTIDNTSAVAASLVFGGNNSAVSIGGTGAYVITNSGGGALSLSKIGSGAATIAYGATLTYTGSTSVSGGTFTVSAPVSGTNALVATGGASLGMLGAIASPSAVRAVNVAASSALSLLDNAGSQLTNLNALTLGSVGGTNSTLHLNVGDVSVAGDNLATDRLGLITGGALTLVAGNKVTFNLVDTGLRGGQTYTLVSSVDGGLITGALGASDWLLGAVLPGGFTSLTLNQTDTAITLVTGTQLTGGLYWRGLTGTTWNGNANNWSTDKAGTLPAASIPGNAHDVIFLYNAPSNAAVTTTLEQSFRINSLTFEANGTPANTATSVTINAGANAASTLDIAPASSSSGILLSAGAPAAVTIGAGLRVVSAQTWTVTDAASVLTLNTLYGSGNVTKAGAGKVVIAAAADPSFNLDHTLAMAVTAGLLELQNAGALGATAYGNLAAVTVSGGAFSYANATSGTVPVPLTLAGGTLTAGGNSQTYSGTVALSANSFVNLRDSNSAVTSTTSRSITLSGVLSGTGSLSLDSIDTAGSGNQLTGTLTLSNAGNTGWSGALNISRGTVTGTSVAALGTGAINGLGFGRLIIQGAGANYAISKALTVANPSGNAVLEYQVDRTSGTDDFVLTNSAAVTLGSAAGTAELRLFPADGLATLPVFSGPVTLANNANIVMANNATYRTTFSGVIGEVGGARNLTINDQATWAQTSGIVRLAGANTFTGALSVLGGTLEITTATDVGAANSLGLGTSLTLSNAILSFVGTTSQTSNRAIAVTNNATLSTAGTVGASITYSGAITVTLDKQLTLTGAALGNTGFLTGGFTQSGTSADLNVNSGTWTLSGATNTVADDVIIQGGVLNLSTAGVVTYVSGTSNGFYVRNAQANFNVSEPLSSQVDFVMLGDATVAGTGILNLNSFTQTTPRLDLGARAANFSGQLDGTGTLAVTTNFNLYRGTVNARLSGAGAILKQGTGTVTFLGDNSGLTGGTAVRIDEGTLALDYTASNTTKLRAATGLDFRGGTLVLTGNATAATLQNVAALTLNSGSSRVLVNPGSGQDAALSFTTFSRTAGQGVLRFVLPTGSQSATNGYLTTAAVSMGAFGGYVTVDTGSGVYFATKTGSNLTALSSTAKNDATTWLGGEHITDTTGGFTGALSYAGIGSLRFDAATGAAISLPVDGWLNISNGGILVTSNVTGGTPGILGGRLSSSISDIIVTHDGTATFEISSQISGAHALTKSGNGVLKLSGNNSYTGVTHVAAGTLQAFGGNAIGDNSPVTLASNQASTLQLFASETIGRLSGGNATTDSLYGLVALGANSLTINNDVNTSYAGFITGSGTLTKQGVGNLQLTNNSSGFTGPVVVNGGLLQLSGIGILGTTSLTINAGATLLLDNSGSTRSSARILDTATITLNSASGAFSGSTVVRGLAIRTDQNATTGETVGVLTFASGASYFSGDASGTTGIAPLSASDFVRQNNATLDARGRNLGQTSSDRVNLRIVPSSANETTFVGTLVGGGGAAATKTISIIPWAMGEATTASLVDTNMGNTLVTYALGNGGIRPLDLTTEYNTYAASVTATENIREALTADLTGLSGKTVNALVLHHNSTVTPSLAFTGTGAGQALAVTSGALLFTRETATTAADTITLGGFNNGITTAGANPEYVIFVVNPDSSAAGSTGKTLTAVINSSLSSTADLTKSGRGTLVLSVANTAGGGTKKTTLNEGVLEIAALDRIGGTTGGLVFAGGTLRLGAGFSQDFTTRTLTLFSGGSTIDTNGISLALANSLGSGVGGLTLTGGGVLTLGGVSTYTGATVVNAGGLVLTGGASNRLSASTSLAVNAGSVQFGDVGGASSQTMTELSGGASAVILGGNAAISTLTVNQSTNTTFAGSFGGIGTNENSLGLVKTGNGVLTLSGATVAYAGGTTVTGGTLNVTGGTTAALVTSSLAVGSGATFNVVNGVGQSVNLGGGALSLTAGAGILNLGLEVGASGNYDRFTTSAVATTSGKVLLDLTGLSGFTSGTYDLLTAGGGLTGATYSIASLSGAIGGQRLSLGVNSTTVQLTATALTGALYWKGGLSSAWFGIGGLNTNFTTDLAGTLNANGVPGAANTVVFNANGQSGIEQSVTLDKPVAISDLIFNSNVGSGPLGSVSLLAGAAGTLTLAPASASAGVELQAGAPALVTLAVPVVLGADQTWTVADVASQLSVTGVISGSGALTKAGSGILQIGAASTYTGVTTVTAGVLRAGIASAFSAGSAFVVDATGTLRLNGFSTSVGSLAGVSGAVVENSGTANATLTAGANNSSTLFAGVLRDGSTGTLALTKTGTGALTLSGASTLTGGITVSNGTLNLTGSVVGNTTSSVLAAGSAGNISIVNVSGDLTLFATRGANADTAVSVYNQTAGTVLVSPGTANNQYIVSAAGSYGYFNLTGGTYKNVNRFDTNASNAPTPAKPAVSVMYVGGTGFLDHTNAEWFINGYSYGTITVGAGGTIDHSGSSAQFAITMDNAASGGSYGVLNLSGGSVLTGSQPLRFGNSTTNGSGNSGYVNIAAGVLSTGANISTALNASGANNLYFNFAGGTVRATANLTAWLPSTVSGATLNATIFGPVDNSAVSGAPSFDGGLTIDTNGFAVGIAAPLRGATGVGVRQADLTVNGGSGYVGAPLVQFSTAGVVAGGTPAQGYALISGGAVVGIVITDPGTYVSGTVPTVTLLGGGGTGASVTAASLLVANTSGGLTKNGAGTLTLASAATYTGATTINAGTFLLTLDNLLADASSVVVAGGTFDLGAFSDTVAGFRLSGGTITGSGGVLTSASDYDLRSGTAAGILGGTSGVVKTTSGTVLMTGSHTFSGPVAVNGGVLSFTTDANLGNGGGSNNISLGGGTLNYAGGTAYSTARTVTVDAAGGGISVQQDVTMTVTNGLSGTGNFTKSGVGTLLLPGDTNLGSGVVNVSAGRLRAAFGTAGVGGLTVATGAHMDFVNGQAQALGSLGTLGLAAGSFLSLELNGTANDSLAFLNPATVAGKITLNLVSTGSGVVENTYTLISGPSGLSAGNFALGTAPTGFNYTINVSDTAVTLTTTPYTPIFWLGGQNNSWSTLGAGPANWSSDEFGYVDSGHLPLANETVVMGAATAPFSGNLLATTLDAAITIDSLHFTAFPGAFNVVINPGTGGTLTLTPVSTSGGITAFADSGAAVINAPLTVGASQTWNIDASSASLTLNGSVHFGYDVNKTGGGPLTLTATNTGTANLTISAGTLNLNGPDVLGGTKLILLQGSALDNTTAGAITLSTTGQQAWNGNFTFVGTRALSLGTGAVTLGNNVKVTVAASTLTVGGNITDGLASYGLTKDGAGTLVLTGTTSFDGALTLQAGALTLQGSNPNISGVNVTGGTLNFRNAAALGAGTLTLGNGATIDNTNGAPLALTGGNAQTWGTGFTFAGSSSLDLGSGVATLTSDATVTVTANTLTVGTVTDGASLFGLTKDGAGTLALSAAASFKGGLVLKAGTLAFTANQSLTASTNTLTFGATAGATGVAALNLSAASATFGGGLLVQTDSASANTLAIGAGQTLRINGTFIVGYNSAATSASKLTVSGAGTLSVGAVGAPTNLGMTIGNAQGNNVSNAGNLDLSGLANLYVNLGTGTFRVGDPANSGGTGTAGSTLTLAQNSTVFATTFTTDTPSGNVTQVVKIGSGTTEFNVNSMVIGGAANRAIVTMDFSGAGGTFRLRNLAGTGRATLDVQNGNSASGFNLSGDLNLAGHTADLLVGTLTVGGRSAQATGGGTGSFAFSAGVLDATTMVIGTRTGSTATTGQVTSTVNLNQSGGTGTVTVGTLNMGINSVSNTGTNGRVLATLNIGGGTVGITTMSMANNSIAGATNQTNAPVNSTVSISGGAVTVSTLTMNTNSSANTGTNNASLSTLNISGGTVNVGTLNMAVISNAAATGTSVLNLTGGTLTVSTSFGYTVGAGTENTTLLLNGGTLDLQGNALGSATAPIGSGTGSLTFQSGTLANVGAINGTAGVTKSGGSSTLTLSGTNTFSGSITIGGGSGSVLAVASAASLGSGTLVTVGDSTTFRSTGSFTTSRALALAGTNPSLSADAATTLTLSGVITTTSTSPRLTGLGTVVFSGGSNSFASNTVLSVTSGAFGFGHASALSGAALRLNGTTGLDNLSGATLAASGVTALELATGFTFAGTNDLNLGVAASFVTNAGAVRTIGVTAGTLTIGGILTTGTDAVGTARVNGGLTKTGAGTLTLSGASDYTGATLVSGGTLSAVSGALASTTSITVNGATLSAVNYNGAATLTLDATATATISGTGLSLAAITNSGTLSFTGSSGLITLAGHSGTGVTTFASNASITTVSGGTLELNGLTNTISTLSGGALTLGSGDVSIAAGTGGVIGGTGAHLYKTGPGLLVLGSANTFTAAVEVSGGTLQVATLGDGVSDSSLGHAALTSDKLVFAGGELSYTGAGESSARGFTVKDGGVALTASGTGALQFNSSSKVDFANTTGTGRTLTLGGTSTAANQFGSTMLEGNEAADRVFTGIIKNGVGKWIVSAPQEVVSSSGQFAVNGGILVINGVYLNNATVAASATLAGSGSLGAVSVSSGGTVAPGNSPGTLTMSSLSLAGGAAIEWQVRNADAAAGTGYDHLGITGTLDLSAASLGNKIVLRIISLTGADAIGNAENFFASPHVFNFATIGGLNLGANASISDVFSIDVSQLHFTDGSTSAAGLWSLSYDNAGTVTLTAVPEPSTYGFGLAALALAAAAYRRRRQKKPAIQG